MQSKDSKGAKAILLKGFMLRILIEIFCCRTLKFGNKYKQIFCFYKIKFYFYHYN